MTIQNAMFWLSAHYSQVGQHKYLTSHIVTDTVHGE